MPGFSTTGPGALAPGTLSGGKSGSIVFWIGLGRRRVFSPNLPVTELFKDLGENWEAYDRIYMIPSGAWRQGIRTGSSRCPVLFSSADDATFSPPASGEFIELDEFARFLARDGVVVELRRVSQQQSRTSHLWLEWDGPVSGSTLGPPDNAHQGGLEWRVQRGTGRGRASRTSAGWDNWFLQCEDDGGAW